MSQIDNLLSNYKDFIAIPWADRIHGAQKVLFAVYPPTEERRLRAKIREFEIATRDTKREWHLVDVTNCTAEWLGEHEYKDGYFSDPSAIENITHELKDRLVATISKELESPQATDSAVVALLGIGSLFGFIHISSVLTELDNKIKGRLLVFFPGVYEQNRYRFLDARDGFNYMAMPITCEERMKI